jgi:phosphopantothenate synthetase
MKLSLQQNEIQAALRDYVANQGITTQGKDVTFDFTMGRKGTGLTVEVTITAPVTKVSVPTSFTGTTPSVTVFEEAEEVTETTTTNPGYSTTAPVTGSLFGST